MRSPRLRTGTWRRSTGGHAAYNGVLAFQRALGGFSPVVEHDRKAPEDDLIRLYLTDIGKHELLSRADEVMLAFRAAQAPALQR